MDQEEELKKYESAGDNFLIATVQRMRLFLACYCGEYNVGATLAFDWGDLAIKLLPGHPINFVVLFASSLSCLAMARKTGKKRFLAKGKHFHRIVKHWSEKQATHNPNCVHHEVLLEAEMAALANKRKAAYKLFESAVLLSGRRGMIHDQALASERFAEFCLEQNDQDEAKYRIGEAMKLYKEWGARYKTGLLRSKFESLLGKGPEEPSPPTEIAIP